MPWLSIGLQVEVCVDYAWTAEYVLEEIQSVGPIYYCGLRLVAQGDFSGTSSGWNIAPETVGVSVSTVDMAQIRGGSAPCRVGEWEPGSELAVDGEWRGVVQRSDLLQMSRNSKGLWSQLLSKLSRGNRSHSALPRNKWDCVVAVSVLVDRSVDFVKA